MKFKDFYQFTFTFAKNPGQKGLGEYKIQTCKMPHLNETVSGQDQQDVSLACYSVIIPLCVFLPTDLLHMQVDQLVLSYT